MSDTPDTDRQASGIDQSNFEDSWKDDFEPYAWVQADFARKLERDRNKFKLVFDELDELMHLMKPRYCGTPSMDGRYPCWIVWLPRNGTCERKSLSAAMMECAEQIKTIDAATGEKP